MAACSPDPVDDRVVAARRRAPSACRGPSRSSGRRPSRSARRDGPPRAAPRGRATNPSAERGGVSRPSRSAWTRTAATPVPRGQLGERDEVAVVGVDAARARSGRRRGACRPVARARSQASSSAGPLEERAVGDRGVDARQVLEHRPAGAEVEVADLRVAHLARRQADGVLGRAAGRCAASARGGRASVGIAAAAIASPAGSRPIPNPSRTTRTIGRGRPGARPGGHAAAARAALRAVSAGPGRRSRPSRRA